VPWIDTHAHLDDSRFDPDRDEVLERARLAGLKHILTIGVDLSSSQASIHLADQHPQLLSAVVGIQPNHVGDARPCDWDQIVLLARDSQAVALGETGLDRYWDRAPFPLQEDYFDRHLRLARTLNLPVVIHNREADADVVRMLRAEYDRAGPIAGVMHSFATDLATAEACLAMGLHVSFAGMLSYKTAGSLRDVAARVPQDRLLVETDSPYLAPVPHRGKRNEPGNVVHTGSLLAELHGISPEQMAALTTTNARQLFRLP
jgi:TatD DNase family protein